MSRLKFNVRVLLGVFMISSVFGYYIRDHEDKTKCPKVKAMRNFDLSSLLGKWFVLQYFASSEEALSYKCMRADFTDEVKILSNSKPEVQMTMNFTYAFINDPLHEQLLGNITWQVPDGHTPAHWVHAEDTYEGIYNTYVLDTDYVSWTLLMHCAEKEDSPRYLSAFIMSRGESLGVNVINFLRDKLPRYDIDLNYMFEMSQTDCEPETSGSREAAAPPLIRLALASRRRNARRRHPMKRHHKSTITSSSTTTPSSTAIHNSISSSSSSSSSAEDA